MTALPSALHDHLAAPSLVPMWAVLRERLERTGHAIRGTLVIELDDDFDRFARLFAEFNPDVFTE